MPNSDKREALKHDFPKKDHGKGERVIPMSGFKFKCNDCGQALNGERAAKEHANTHVKRRDR